MKKFKRKGFTLIELIAVLVIMAIIALIVTPFVISIIRKAKVSADKRSIDAYGRSVELAIAGYLLDNGKFPTDISQLTIEYSGDEVVCSTTQLNPDSSVYLSGCKVNNRDVNYEYGTDKTPSYQVYSVGDIVTYNNIDFYVIRDSGLKEENVTLLKTTPLSTFEVNQYGVGHINRYTREDRGTVYKSVDGYGYLAYYISETCGYNSSSDEWVYDDCTNAYDNSEVKYVVDAWKTANVPAATEARLFILDDLVDNLGYEYVLQGTSFEYIKTESTPSWLSDGNNSYWIGSQNNDSSSDVWCVGANANLEKHKVDSECSVRPVIVLSKSALQS